MPPRPAHIETIAISSDNDDDDDNYMAGLQLLHRDQAPELPNAGQLDTPLLDDDSDWGDLLNFTHEFEAIENAQLHTDIEMTADDCLARILEIFPNISRGHVKELLREKKKAGKEASASLCDELIDEILDGGDYPTERQVRRANLKRKYRGSSEESDYARVSDDKTQGYKYKEVANHLLLKEFLDVPKRFVTATLGANKSAFQAYLVIEEAERQYSATQLKDRPYRRVVKPRRDQDLHYPPTDKTMRSVKKEMAAAKKKAAKGARKREEERLKALAEERNEAAARANNDMTECGCCFTEYPTNRMTFCNGEHAHFFCYRCANLYVGTEIGQRKCRPKCMDTGGCDADFSRSQLKAFLDDKTFEALERLQQQEDLRNAGIEGLDDCPFCDFKMICAPKEVDREFRCHNEDCAVVSCRLCRQETHIPLTCEQASKDKKIDVRHKVEEAMTAALIRECNKCKNKFIKEFGCNKMTCTSCRNLQCYVCSKDVKDYHHFGEGRDKCPLYENTEQRHENEVQKAEKAAFEQLKKENPDISEEDLKIQVSEAVKKADKERIARGGLRGVANPLGHNPDDLYARYVRRPGPVVPRIPELQQVGRAAPPPVDAAAGQGVDRENCPCRALDWRNEGRHHHHMPHWQIAAILRTCHCGRYGDALAPAYRPAPVAFNPFTGAPPLGHDPAPPVPRHPYADLAPEPRRNLVGQRAFPDGQVEARLPENIRQRMRALQARTREIRPIQLNARNEEPLLEPPGRGPFEPLDPDVLNLLLTRQANQAIAEARDIMAVHNRPRR
ncbi:hypothetical protein IWX49DRAFT_552915 [Phyllosticta citricarpa]|uniref:RING-type domain-containing protein n=1 Tax=Phyllosticta paracitricarpa TaxID=2016321 RepID=A0ABR1NJS8_9PEZI